MDATTRWALLQCRRGQISAETRQKTSAKTRWSVPRRCRGQTVGQRVISRPERREICRSRAVRPRITALGSTQSGARAVRGPGAADAVRLGRAPAATNGSGCAKGKARAKQLSAAHQRRRPAERKCQTRIRMRRAAGRRLFVREPRFLTKPRPRPACVNRR